MNQHLVAFDLDGTLLDNDHSISSETIISINKIQNQNNLIAIATGRSFSACKLYANQINADYIVACNGAMIYDVNQKEIIKKTPIPKNTAIDILNQLYEHNDKLKIQWDSFDTYFSNNLLPFEENYINVFKREYPDEVFNMAIIESRDKIIEYNFDDIYQIFTYSLIKPHTEYFQVLDNLKSYEDLHYVDFKMSYTDITHKDVDKGTALGYIADLNGLDYENVVAFGDSYNDRTMLEYAGISVAMGNADEEIKNIAKNVTKANSEDGVGDFLKHYFKM
ncbi:Cof-type HAD-IIB family hydrolase [Alkalibacter mobilis]|uniref:Cof-type HAD-IIB family hydrolase n=1 Tax=Alkalibacter mobilis TaxID=2787712 RepID=UPI00189EA3DC|nr:HAD family hydrolase [Alkalibacter mobilis]MBF7097525.1 HAD family phosphatase [Alkalibacter mobilis]